MTDAIAVANLTKEYVLGGASVNREYRTMRDALSGWMSTAFTNRGKPRRFRALDDVSFTVPQGGTVGIIGRNGAGKSTLLKALSRITEPTSGTITIHGRVSSLLEVGTGFHPELTGRENIYLNGSLLGMRRTEIVARFDEIVAFSEIDQFLDTPVKRYSSGMYVRLAFAVAAHLEPEILIVDEVLAVGDVAFQKKCLGKMEDIGHSGRTVLFVSHNMAAITRLCPRVILLRQGKVVGDGKALDVVKQYLSEGSSGQGLVTELLNETRRGGNYGTVARLASLELRPSATAPEFRFGEDFRLRIRFRSIAAVLHAAVGIGIDDMYSSRLMTFNSDESGVTVHTERGGDYTIDLCVPRPCLNPGRYSLSCAVLSGGQILDFVANATAFDVLPLDDASGAHIEPTEGAGPIRLPCSWTV
ncbi:MAG TPA: ABC transporter ATP-binding protein [Gemmatimonadaceae bacterium]|nr:ABC transporter ATP-binding protein [Gemmatimonadaceae bacterium]